MKLYSIIFSSVLTVSLVAPSMSAVAQVPPVQQSAETPSCKKEQDDPRGCSIVDRQGKKESPVGRGDGRRKASKEEPKKERGDGRDDRMNGGSDKPVTFPPTGSPKDSHGGTR